MFDDIIHIQNNPLLTSPSGFWPLLTEPAFPGNLFRPLTYGLFWLHAQLFTVAPFSFHFMTLLLHGANGVLLFFVLRETKWNRYAFSAALFFAVHPVHTEVVTNVVGSAELLAFFFGMLGILCFLRERFISPMLFFLLAAFSKESGVVFPLLAALSSFVSTKQRSKQVGRLMALTLPVYVMFFFCRTMVVDGIGVTGGIDFVDNPIAGLPSFERISNALLLFAKYIALAFFPYPLSADYSYAATIPQPISLFSISISLVLMVVFLLSTMFFMLKRSVIGYSVLWFCLSFLITANILFPIGTVFADRLLYTPTVAASLLLAALLHLFSRESVRYGAIFLVCFAYASWAYQYQYVWSSQQGLFQWQKQFSPQSVKTKINFATLLRNKGEFNEATKLLEEALALYPQSADAHFTLGTIDALQGDSDDAEAKFRKALSYNTSHTPTLVALARKLLNDREFQEADQLLSLAVSLEPYNIRAKVAQYGLALAQADLPHARALEKEILSYRISDREFFTLRSKLIEVIQKGS